jgi:hypothetical protein
MDALITYRGRRVTEEDAALIRTLIEENPRASRRALSRKLCLAWGWRQPTLDYNNLSFDRNDRFDSTMRYGWLNLQSAIILLKKSSNQSESQLLLTIVIAFAEES